MIDRRRHRDLAGDGLAVADEHEVDVPRPGEDFLFERDVETEFFRLVLEPILNGFVLRTAAAQIGRGRS